MKNKISLAQTAFYMFLLILACQKEDTVEREYPQIRTSAVNHITADGARFNAEIISGDIESISEYGFVWGLTSTLSIQGSEKVVIGSVPSGNDFYSDITYALEEMKDYYVRSYVKAGELTIYGDAVKFKSLGSQAPVITDFEPKSATWGDTVTIFGKNLSFQRNNISVYFGDINAQVTSSNNEFIKVTVPDGIQFQSVISAEIYGNISIAEDSFELITPGKITTIDKVDITWEDTLKLEGVFPFSEYTLNVTIDNAPAKLIEITETKMSIIVPSSLVYSDTVSVILSIDGHKLPTSTRNHMIKPYITSIAQSVFGWGDTIVFNGLFNPDPNKNKVVLSNTPATVIGSTQRTLTCIVPSTSSHACDIIVKVSNLELVYQGNLTLSGPVIKEINPSKVTSGEYVWIKGKYFKNNATRAKINGKDTFVEMVESDKMRLYIPGDIIDGPANIDIQVYEKHSLVNNMLTISNPSITNFQPKKAFYDEIITIVGKGFYPGDLQVNIGGYVAEVIDASENQIKIKVPNSISWNSYISVTTSGHTVYSDSSFTLTPPEITSVYPLMGKPGDIITVTGNFFNPQSEMNKVLIDNVVCETVSSETNQIQCRLPSLLRGEYSLSLYTEAYNEQYSSKVNLQSPWSIYNRLYMDQAYGSAVMYDGAVILFGGLGTEYLYQRFSFQGGDHQIFIDCPLYSNIGGVAYNSNEMIYYGLGFNYPSTYNRNFYRFNPDGRTWTRLSDFPGDPRSYSFYFSIDNRCYLGTGRSSSDELYGDFWEYITTTDTWIRKDDFPGGSSGMAIGISLNGRGYVVDGKELWEFNPNGDNWTRKADFPGNERYLAIGFALNGMVYFGTGSQFFTSPVNYEPGSNDLWRYDPANDQWQRLANVPNTFSAAFGVPFNFKGYIGGGKNTMQILEYDPAYE